MNKSLFLSLSIQVLALFICSISLDGQYSKVEEISTFGKRINNPVVMDVQESSDRVYFNANNKSYYPYDLTIKFNDIQNLLPKVFERKMILQPGNNILFVLSVADKEQAIYYDYRITFGISLSSDPDLTFPYLLPIASGRTVEFQSIITDNGKINLINQFKMAQYDTVFAIRKGTITALPDDNSEIERIVSANSLEILHGDGTVAIYRGLDEAFRGLHTGQIIYPRQPIGIMRTNGTLILNLVSMQGITSVKNQNILYADEQGNTIPANQINGKSVLFSEQIIKKEMTEKEIKKYEKGNLYK